MKNKIGYIFLGLLVSFLFMNNVFAEGELDFSVTANVVGGETTVVTGKEVTINVALNSDVYISTCTFEITHDSGIESVSKLGMNNYLVEAGETKIIIDRSVTDTEFVSGQNVLELKYKINEAGKITIKTLDCTSPTDNMTGSYEDIVLNFDVKDVQDTTLSNIIVTGGVLSPIFSSSVKRYNIKLDSPEFSLQLIASDSSFQDKIVVKDSNGNIIDVSKITFSDSSGQAIMKLLVYVNDVEEYTLFVKYEQTDLDNSLDTLKVYGKEIELVDGVYEYTVTVGSSVNSVKIDATLKDSENFKFSENNGPTTFQIPNATNTYPLIIEPANSSIGAEGVTYIITIKKEVVDDTSDSSSSGSQQNTTTNPATGGISMYIMMFILFASLISSIVLYQKNLNGFDK